jgi:hypothetical protein
MPGAAKSATGRASVEDKKPQDFDGKSGIELSNLLWEGLSCIFLLRFFPLFRGLGLGVSSAFLFKCVLSADAVIDWG